MHFQLTGKFYTFFTAVLTTQLRCNHSKMVSDVVSGCILFFLNTYFYIFK